MAFNPGACFAPPDHSRPGTNLRWLADRSGRRFAARYGPPRPWSAASPSTKIGQQADSKAHANIQPLWNQYLATQGHFAGAQTKDARRRSLVQCTILTRANDQRRRLKRARDRHSLVAEVIRTHRGRRARERPIHKRGVGVLVLGPSPTFVPRSFADPREEAIEDLLDQRPVSRGGAFSVTASRCERFVVADGGRTTGAG